MSSFLALTRSKINVLVVDFREEVRLQQPRMRDLTILDAA
jgi:hypothetical protein